MKTNTQHKNILVTGGAGYIGTACVDTLLKAGHSVTVFDNLSTGQADKVPTQAHFIEGDITDQAALRAACTSDTFDAVMHLAAKKAVGESEANPSLYFHTNVVGSYNLLHAMEAAGIKQLVFSSTAAVYAPPEHDAPLTEESPLGPISIYGTTKHIVEEMIMSYVRTGKIQQYSILRYFNVAGDVGLEYQEQDAQNVFPILAAAIDDGSPFSIFGTDYDTSDGTCVRDYIHLNDLVDGHLKALESDVSGIYNLGTGTGYSVRDLVDMFAKVSGRSLNVIETARRAGDAAVVVAAAKRAESELHWQPKHTLTDMVESTLACY